MSETEQQGASLVRAAPVLIRLGVSAWWRGTEWMILTWLHTSARMMRAAASGQSAAQLLLEAEAELREQLRRLLGIEPYGSEGPPPAPTASEPHVEARDRPARNGRNGRITAVDLREMGAELLRRSADVEYDEDGHPAYAQILEQLTPDEARVLRLLLQKGPQPAVDVRTAGPLGVIKSDLVAPGLNMIGVEAGVKHLDRVHAYLNNLYRLGLLWFSREPLDDVGAYQVLEAQPEVAAAMGEAGRGKTVRRSIHLTSFGSDFCDLCLPVDTGEIEALGGQEAGGRPTSG